MKRGPKLKFYENMKRVTMLEKALQTQAPVKLMVQQNRDGTVNIPVPLKILALDPATHCGYAIDKTLYGVWDLTPKRDESIGMRLIRFRSKLNEILISEQINLVVFERAAGQHVHAVIVQSEIQGQIKVICEDFKIEYRAYSSQEIKKFATGKGNCGKPAMIQAAQTKLGYTGNNDNEADALWLLELAKSEYK